jgi:AcrR family transcriptional regulator
VVVTPWGASEQLRDRAPRPGSAEPADLADSQRERLLGAMVACVAEKGYEATRVADLVTISGVSRRTFYELFADKAECFLATLDALVGLVLRPWLHGREGSWEERARADAEAFGEMLLAQPAAATVCLVEAAAAGPEALQLLEEAVNGFETLALSAAAESPRRTGMPEEMVAAYVGSIQEVARARLLRGEEAELPRLLGELAELMLSYDPPPRRLRPRGRPPKAAPERVEGHDHAERALAAFTIAVAEEGYVGTTVERIAKRAGISATTFYANFAGKEDLALAAIDSAATQALAAAMPAFRRAPDWASGVRAAIAALYGFLASRPSLARLLLVEVHAAGPAALARRREAMRPLQAMIADGPSVPERAAAVTQEAILGGIYAMAHRQICRGGPEGLPSLAPLAAYLVLAPFLGTEEACAVAAGGGSVGGGAAGISPAEREALRNLVDSRLPQRIAQLVAEHPASAEEIARRLGVGVEQVAEGMVWLQRASFVELSPEQGDGSEGPVYRSRMGLMYDRQWSRLSRSDRRLISTRVWNLIVAEVERALELDTFDDRLDRHLSHLTMRLDEQGWRELGEIHNDALDASLEVRTRANDRLRESGAPSIDVCAVQLTFALPRDPDDDA